MNEIISLIKRKLKWKERECLHSHLPTVRTPLKRGLEASNSPKQSAIACIELVFHEFYIFEIVVVQFS